MDQEVNSLDVYPSTFDYQKDPRPLMRLIENARERYATDGAVGTFVCDGRCCAVGAIWQADGQDWPEISSRWMADREMGLTMTQYVHEVLLSETAKKAIALLDATALELYPEEAVDRLLAYTGPLECLNEKRGLIIDFTDRTVPVENKLRVLKVYDTVIERLKAQRSEHEEVPYEAESWGTPIEREPEHEPVVPPELATV